MEIKNKKQSSKLYQECLRANNDFAIFNQFVILNFYCLNIILKILFSLYIQQ